MLILWMLGCYSSTAVRQQKRCDRRNKSSSLGLLDRPSPQIADVLPLSISTLQRSLQRKIICCPCSIGQTGVGRTLYVPDTTYTIVSDDCLKGSFICPFGEALNCRRIRWQKSGANDPLVEVLKSDWVVRSNVPSPGRRPIYQPHKHCRTHDP